MHFLFDMSKISEKIGFPSFDRQQVKDDNLKPVELPLEMLWKYETTFF